MNLKKIITLNEFEQQDIDFLLKMSLELWTEFDKNKLKELLEETSKSKKNKIFIAKNFTK